MSVRAHVALLDRAGQRLALEPHEHAWALPEFAIEGAVDRRAAVVAGQHEPLLYEAEERALLDQQERDRLPELLPKLRETLAALTACGLPETLVHGDMHLGNAVMTPTGPLFFDWSDAAVAHPFVDLFMLLDYPDDPLAERHDALKLAYLEPWQQFAPPASLRRACDLALTLAPAYHAISYQHLRAAQEPASRWQLGGAAAAFLRSLLRLFDLSRA